MAWVENSAAGSYFRAMRYDAAMPDNDTPSHPFSNQPPEGSQPPGGGGDAPNIQQIHHDPVSARVPDRVARGIFATGVLVQEGSGEFVLDFVQALTRPVQIAARVVVTPPVMSALVSTFSENIARYTEAFGPPPPLPKSPPPARRPTTQEIYENFKLSDDLLSGVYANSVMVGHHPAEFFLDFITRFYPTAAVSCRIYVSAAQAPKIQEILHGSFQQYLRRTGSGPTPPTAAP
jgi:hypothetical protein